MASPFPLPHPWVPGSEENPFEARIQENQDKIAIELGNKAPIAGAVTSLPTTPYDGQEIYYTADSTNGVVWHLKYRAASGSSYKWEYVGGAPLFAEVTTNQSTTSTSYAALTTAGPAVTLPLAGDYMVAIGCRCHQNGNSRDALMSYDIGATGAVDADATTYYSGASVDGLPATVAANVMVERRKTGLTAVTLTAKYKVSAGQGNFSSRWMKVVPVRVG